MGFLRPLALFFLLLGLVHLVLRVWLRLRERQRLATEWETGSRLGERETYVREGMEQYDHSLGKRLLWLTIVGPMAMLILVLYLVNET